MSVTVTDAELVDLAVRLTDRRRFGRALLVSDEKRMLEIIGELRAEVERLNRPHCLYCDWGDENPYSMTVGEIQAHINVCEHHPLPRLRRAVRQTLSIFYEFRPEGDATLASCLSEYMDALDILTAEQNS